MQQSASGQPPAAAASSNGAAVGQGLRITFSWLVKPQTLTGEPSCCLRGRVLLAALMALRDIALCLRNGSCPRHGTDVRGVLQAFQPSLTAMVGATVMAAVSAGLITCMALTHMCCAGELTEVRSRTAVKGGWVGGRM